MSNSIDNIDTYLGERKSKAVTALRTHLRLRTDGDVAALLVAHPLREAFRIYRNRCLVPTKNKLPDWKDVDDYLYELELSAEFRQFAIGSNITRSAADALLAYVSKLGIERPYELKPHVAGFVLRVTAFWDSKQGARFDVPRPVTDGGGGKDYENDREFDRYVRIMKLLAFMVERE